MRKLFSFMLAVAAFPTAAEAAPGLGTEVYPATVEAGETEAEVLYNSLRGGPDHGEDVFKLEVSHGFSSDFQLGLTAEFEREPGLPREAEALGIEAIYHLGKIGKKTLAGGQRLELSYAGSATYAVGEIDLGIAAFGDLGTFDRLFPRAEHFIGPVAKVEIEGLGPEFELSAGYLFALGAARDDTKGQLRLGLELEF